MRTEIRIRKLERKYGLDKSIETSVLTVLYGCDESHGPQLEAEGCVREGDSWMRYVKASEKWERQQEALGRRMRVRIMYRITKPYTGRAEFVDDNPSKKLNRLVNNRRKD